MLRNVGVIPYKNNNHRKALFKMLKSELGNDIKIWVENNIMYYEYKTDPDVMYL
jgi:hypothetical protein